MSLGDELPQPVTALVDAINNLHEEAFVAAFAPEGYVDDWGRVLRGADGVRSWSQTDAIGMNASMTVLSASTDGDTTHITFEWKSDRFDGQSEAYVTVADGKVTRSGSRPADSRGRLSRLSSVCRKAKGLPREGAPARRRTWLSQQSCSPSVAHIA